MAALSIHIKEFKGLAQGFHKVWMLFQAFTHGSSLNSQASVCIASNAVTLQINWVDSTLR